ncbi:hypothetical protein LINPERPRIM_LOCUS13279, partial [Linum perenne]
GEILHFDSNGRNSRNLLCCFLLVRALNSPFQSSSPLLIESISHQVRFHVRKRIGSQRTRQLDRRSSQRRRFRHPSFSAFLIGITSPLSPFCFPLLDQLGKLATCTVPSELGNLALPFRAGY